MLRPFLLALCLAGSALAQPADSVRTPAPGIPAMAPAEPDSAARFGGGWGARVRVSESGFGLGAYATLPLSPDWSAVAVFHLSNVTDERESKFFGLGGVTIPEKLHYLLVLPMQVGAQRRLFRRNIAPNFRPFVGLTLGPTLAWRSPYFDDCNRDNRITPGVTCDGLPEGEVTFSALGSLERGRMLVGLGTELSLGADFGTDHRVQGLRIGVSVDYFPTRVRLLESDARAQAQSRFASPFVTLTFGRRQVVR
jgi:hypothetical protein